VQVQRPGVQLRAWREGGREGGKEGGSGGHCYIARLDCLQSSVPGIRLDEGIRGNAMRAHS